jgi:hypothetical protein
MMATEEFSYPPELMRFLQYQPEQPGPLPATLDALEQLLYGIWGKQSGKTALDQQALSVFQRRCGLDDELVVEQEQRVLRALDRKLPVLIGLDTRLSCQPGQDSVLRVLVMNPTTSPYREIQIRFSAPKLLPEQGGQPRPLRQLAALDAASVALHYRAPAQPLLAMLTVAVDLCDQHGTWHAYNSRSAILLQFAGPGGDSQVKLRATHDSNTALYRRFAVPTTGLDDDFARSLEHLRSQRTEGGTTDLEQRQLLDATRWLPIELVLDAERSRQLQASALTKRRAGRHGTPLTRALLRCQTPAHAPARVELVSHPFLVFGRYNDTTQTGFGDFALGFVKGFQQISRFHCAISAQANGLAIMHVGGQNRGYTALNTQVLPRGQWQPLAANAVLDIGGLYTLRVKPVWDSSADAVSGISPLIEGERLGQALLALVDLLRQPVAGGDRNPLRRQYGEFRRLQRQAAQLNGLDSRGPLHCVCFQRQDAGRQRVLHVYLPKRLSIGSSADAGLQLVARDVALTHAELWFKDGMYWLCNLAASGSVRVGGQPLGTAEAVPLESGDAIRIGSVRFVFERY